MIEPINLLVFESVRFIILQVVITSLQLQNRAQAVIVWLANLAYIIYFAGNSCRSRKIRIQKNDKIVETNVKFLSLLFFRLKLYSQEVCIGIILSIILLISFTKNTGFETSRAQAILEDAIIGLILLAILTEFLWVITSIVLQLLSLRQKSKKAREDTKYVFRSEDLKDDLNSAEADSMSKHDHQNLFKLKQQQILQSSSPSNQDSQHRLVRRRVNHQGPQLSKLKNDIRRIEESEAEEEKQGKKARFKLEVDLPESSEIKAYDGMAGFRSENELGKNSNQNAIQKGIESQF